MGYAYEDAGTSKSRYALPPPEAWINPDVWLEPDGLSIRQDAPRFTPELNSDGVVKPIETTEKVLSLFHASYKWPVNHHHPELIIDVHHFQHDDEKYKPEHHNGSTVPRRFRELPILKGKKPRQLHVVDHAVLLEPNLPEFEVMEEYCNHYYRLADLHQSAHNTLEARRMFAVRQADVARNPARLGNRKEDTIGKHILSREHERHYANYRQHITEHQDQKLPPILPEYVDYTLLDTKKPHVIRKALLPLGRIATDSTINFIPTLSIRAA